MLSHRCVLFCTVKEKLSLKSFFFFNFITNRKLERYILFDLYNIFRKLSGRTLVCSRLTCTYKKNSSIYFVVLGKKEHESADTKLFKRNSFLLIVEFYSMYTYNLFIILESKAIVYNITKTMFPSELLYSNPQNNQPLNF